MAKKNEEARLDDDGAPVRPDDKPQPREVTGVVEFSDSSLFRDKTHLAEKAYERVLADLPGDVLDVEILSVSVSQYVNVSAHYRATVE